MRTNAFKCCPNHFLALNPCLSPSQGYPKPSHCCEDLLVLHMSSKAHSEEKKKKRLGEAANGGLFLMCSSHTSLLVCLLRSRFWWSWSHRSTAAREPSQARRCRLSNLMRFSCCFRSAKSLHVAITMQLLILLLGLSVYSVHKVV